MGGKEAIAPMAALLNDPHLACYARFGMEPNPDLQWTTLSVRRCRS